MRGQHSLLSFAILVVVALSTALLVLVKANEAMNEINQLSNSPVYLGQEEHAR